MSLHKILVKSALITIIFITILSLGQYYLNSKIIKSEQDYYNQQLASLINEINYNNIILDSKVMINNSAYYTLLGKQSPTIIYIAKHDNRPIAVIMNATAPDGYNGNIDLLVAIKLKVHKEISNTIINIKVLNHQETPGLGDLIEPTRSNFIKQFIGKFINSEADNFQSFDSITGATITSRAVNNAVKNCLLLINNHPEIIYNDKKFKDY